MDTINHIGIIVDGNGRWAEERGKIRSEGHKAGAEALEKIFSIFKFIKINPKNVSLMICIAIAFIPTISKQIKQVRDSLKSKGITFNIKNWSLVFEPVTISLLKRVDEIESSLRAKAYQEM